MPARVHQALAGEALLDLGERGRSASKRRCSFDVAGGARVAAFGERLQTVGHAGGRARRLEALPARAVRASSFCSVRRRPRSGSRSTASSTSASKARAQRARRVDQEPAPQHRQRGRDRRRARGSSARPARAAGRRRRRDRSARPTNTAGSRRRRGRRAPSRRTDRRRRARARAPRRRRPAAPQFRRRLRDADDLDGAPLRRKLRTTRVTHLRRAAAAGRGRGAAGATAAATAGATRDARRARATARGSQRQHAVAIVTTNRRDAITRQARRRETVDRKLLSCVL